MIQIAPSILAADLTKLGEGIKELEKQNADLIHIDVMDGMFVPNISFGMPMVKSVRSITALPLDVHLMIEEPSRYVKEFASLGADIITIHEEADKHLDRTLNLITEQGVKASVAINPATPIENLKHVLHLVHMVLIMTVNPGYGGQKFIPYCTEKVRELSAYRDLNKLDFLIQVDGGIDEFNIKEVVDAGADIMVAGSSVFKNNNIEENFKKLREGLI